MRRTTIRLGVAFIAMVAAFMSGGIARTTPVKPLPRVVPADIEAVRAIIRAPGAAAVLVNVWATWCDPCREEMPDLVRLHRARKPQGLRLVLVSADDEEDRNKAATFLASQGVDFQTWLKRGDDMTFIDGLERRWSGALPASFLYDGGGRLSQFWPGPVTYETLDRAFLELTKAAAKSKPTRRNP